MEQGVIKYSSVARGKLFYAHTGKILKTLPKIASKIGATLNGMNLGSKFFPLRAAPMEKKQNT